MAVNNALNITTAGIVVFDGTSAFSADTVTQYDVLVGGASNTISSIGPGSAGQLLLSGGAAANPAYSTPTYPSTSGTSGKILVSDGTNNVYSTPTFPNASATSRKTIISDGTNWIASTETWAVPGTSGNILTSDGTNWTSAASKYGYQLNIATNSANPADGQTYFLQMGNTTTNFTSANNAANFLITQTGTITKFYGTFAFTASPTNENSTLAIRVNNTTDNTISSTIDFSGGSPVSVTNTSLNISVTAGDFITLKWTTPTWSTNPTATTFAGVIWVAI
jgi:hypothetical protein